MSRNRKKQETSQKKVQKKKRALSDEDSDFIPNDHENSDDQKEEIVIRKKLSQAKLDEESECENSFENDQSDSEKNKKNKKKTTNRKRSKPNDSIQGFSASKSRKSSGKKEVSKTVVKKELDAEDLEENKQEEIEEVEVPWFAKKEYMKDEDQRDPTDPDYDPSTLYIPEKELVKMPKTINQYWKIKAKNFDKIVAFKWWKFYYTWFDDAKTVHRYTNYPLKSTWGKYPGCFFHEYSLKNVVPLLLEQGLKVVVVEQMEPTAASKDEVIKRDVCQVITRGTYIDIQNDTEYSTRYLLTLSEDRHNFGFTLIDTTTNKFLIGEFQDDENRRLLRTLVSRFKPVEILHSANLTSSTLSLLKHSINKPTFTRIKVTYPTSFDQILKEMDDPERKNPFFEELGNILEINQSELTKKGEEIEMARATKALFLSFTYLKEILLEETVFRLGSFEFYDLKSTSSQTLFLDSQVLANLEINEIGYTSKNFQNLTLFEFINKTSSSYGKRKLEKWMLEPLFDTTRINERLDAVEDLMQNPDLCEYFQKEIGKIPDIERKIARIYNFANKKRLSADYFEMDYLGNRLKEFASLISDLKKVNELMEIFEEYVDKFKSKRFKQLISFYDIKNKKKHRNFKGLFPKTDEILGEIENMVVYIDGFPCPAPGCDQEYDAIMLQIEEFRKELNNILGTEKKRFNNNSDITFVNSKHRYEIEVPENLVEGDGRPDHYILTSKRKGFIRFQTEEIRDIVYSIDGLQYTCRDRIIPFMIKYLHKFYEYNMYWQQMISCLAEIDCLCGLSVLARNFDIYCRPKFIESEKPVFNLIQMSHPCIKSIKKNFVSNDTSFENETNIILVTGPNMGGKSTILRQNCIAIILAQMGSMVPAKNFDLTPFDRIFTRIGAQDRLLEGKSTFFVEMEETYSIVSEATERSFAIIDELGRGTSTYDGVAIAFSVLKYLTEKIKCFTLFSTHYHMLIDDFRLFKGIKTYYMDFREESENIQFLYKFVEGHVPHSFGINVAKLAGLPSQVINIAKDKSKLLIKEQKMIDSKKKLNSKFDEVIKFLQLI